MTVSSQPVLSGRSLMREILEFYPGARRALFRKYHVGGCAQCGFEPAETLEQVCQRNQISDIESVLRHVRESHELDQQLLIEPKELSQWLARDSSVRLVDIRTREEFEAVHIAGSQFMTQPLMQQILAEGAAAAPVVIVDHLGAKCLDAAAYFLGHGVSKVNCLQGGIDAWSIEVESTLPRYRMGDS